MSFRLVPVLFVVAALTARLPQLRRPRLQRFRPTPAARRTGAHARLPGPVRLGVPLQIDAAGDRDGYVCGVPLAEAYREVHAPAAAVPVIYLLRDNTVTEPQAG